jgi:valyl-tRNA synthetase
VRNIRAEAGTEPGRKIPIVIRCDAGGDFDFAAAVRAAEGHIRSLAGVSSVMVTADEKDVPAEAASAILKGMILYAPLDGLIDYAAEREKLAKEKTRLEGDIGRLSAKLANEGFTAKAPEAVVQNERNKLASAEDALQKTLARMEAIGRE